MRLIIMSLICFILKWPSSFRRISFSLLSCTLIFSPMHLLLMCVFLYVCLLIHFNILTCAIFIPFYFFLIKNGFLSCWCIELFLHGKCECCFNILKKLCHLLKIEILPNCVKVIDFVLMVIVGIVLLQWDSAYWDDRYFNVFPIYVYVYVYIIYIVSIIYPCLIV